MKKIHLDNGCGNNKKESSLYVNFGCGIIRSKVTDVVCNLGFSELPFVQSSIDIITCFDVIEHIPKCLWENRKRILPFIDLMNSCYRILKDQAIIIIETPISSEAYNRDPTHVNHLSEDWYHYFSKEDNLYYDQGLITCNFELIHKSTRKYLWKENDILQVQLKAIKNASIHS